MIWLKNLLFRQRFLNNAYKNTSSKFETNLVLKDFVKTLCCFSATLYIGRSFLRCLHRRRLNVCRNTVENKNEKETSKIEELA